MFNEGHIYHHLVESLQEGSVEDDSDESANAHTLDSEVISFSVAGMLLA